LPLFDNTSIPISTDRVSFLSGKPEGNNTRLLSNVESALNAVVSANYVYLFNNNEITYSKGVGLTEVNLQTIIDACRKN